MYSKNVADIKDQFIGIVKVLVSHQSMKQGFMTLGKIRSQEKCMSAFVCFWELQSQTLQLYSARPGDVSGNDTVIQNHIMRLGVCKKTLQTLSVTAFCCPGLELGCQTVPCRCPYSYVLPLTQ